MYIYDVTTVSCDKCKPNLADPDTLQVQHTITETYNGCNFYTMSIILKEYFDCILDEVGQPKLPNMEDIKKLHLYNNEEQMLSKILSYYCDRYKCYEKLIERLVAKENEKTSGDVSVQFDKTSRLYGCDKEVDGYSWVSESVTVHVEYVPDEKTTEETIQEVPQNEQQENV